MATRWRDKQLDEVLSSRSELNTSIVSELDRAAITWGMKVLRYEIRDITPPKEVINAMELQITAERQSAHSSRGPKARSSRR